MKTITGGAVAAKGYRCAGVRCGLKVREGALDLALIVSDAPALAAGMFTTNRVKAASVVLDQERVASGRKFRGVIVNAGNANACTGERGMRDALRMTELAEKAVGAAPGTFLVCSTGIIGRPMPMEKIVAGVPDAAGKLGRTKAHDEAAQCAIMTTDLVPKAAAVELSIGGKAVRIGGMCKGSGMIAPNMATMLAFVTTDCAISQSLLRKALRECGGRTFNCVTVDGDCSTNDTVLLLSNGAAGNATIRAAGREYALFVGGLLEVMKRLAQAIARDGEGATRFVEVNVIGARTEKEARRVAGKIANSPLVKCAVHGGDPNWGRIICAAGYSGEAVEPERMKLRINGVLLFRNGMPARVTSEKLAACMKPRDIRIVLDLGRGAARSTVWTCDFSKEYVTINADYHT